MKQEKKSGAAHDYRLLQAEKFLRELAKAQPKVWRIVRDKGGGIALHRREGE